MELFVVSQATRRPTLGARTNTGQYCCGTAVPQSSRRQYTAEQMHLSCAQNQTGQPPADDVTHTRSVLGLHTATKPDTRQ